MLKKTEKGTGVSPVPRGIRNNNPLNIRKGAQWQGLRDFPTDKSFCEFKTMALGFRAAYKTLITYYVKHGCKTLRKIIRRWAPPNENDTESYLAYVKMRSGIRVYDQELPDPRNKMAVPIWKDIILAMAEMENGRSMKNFKKDLDIGACAALRT